MADAAGTTPTKLNFTREFDSYRAKHGEFRVLEVPPRRYLMIDGHGDPNTDPQYEAALKALYPVAYAVKFASKRSLGRDYVVPPLEGLWWAEDHSVFTTARDLTQWDWTLLSLIPDWIGDRMVDDAIAQVREKHTPALLDELRVEVVNEGICVQTLHLGPYSEEGPVLEQMHHEVIPECGFTLTGRHHEIYLGDPRRTAPERLRTILRQPVLR